MFGKKSKKGSDSGGNSLSNLSDAPSLTSKKTRMSSLPPNMFGFSSLEGSSPQASGGRDSNDSMSNSKNDGIIDKESIEESSFDRKFRMLLEGEGNEEGSTTKDEKKTKKKKKKKKKSSDKSTDSTKKKKKKKKKKTSTEDSGSSKSSSSSLVNDGKDEKDNTLNLIRTKGSMPPRRRHSSLGIPGVNLGTSSLQPNPNDIQNVLERHFIEDENSDDFNDMLSATNKNLDTKKTTSVIPTLSSTNEDDEDNVLEDSVATPTDMTPTESMMTSSTANRTTKLPTTTNSVSTPTRMSSKIDKLAQSTTSSLNSMDQSDSISMSWGEESLMEILAPGGGKTTTTTNTTTTASSVTNNVTTTTKDDAGKTEQMKMVTSKKKPESQTTAISEVVPFSSSSSSSSFHSPTDTYDPMSIAQQRKTHQQRPRRNVEKTIMTSDTAIGATTVSTDNGATIKDLRERLRLEESRSKKLEVELRELRSERLMIKNGGNGDHSSSEQALTRQKLLHSEALEALRNEHAIALAAVERRADDRIKLLQDDMEKSKILTDLANKLGSATHLLETMAKETRKERQENATLITSQLDVRQSLIATLEDQVHKSRSDAEEERIKLKALLNTMNSNSQQQQTLLAQDRLRLSEEGARLEALQLQLKTESEILREDIAREKQNLKDEKSELAALRLSTETMLNEQRQRLESEKARFHAEKEKFKAVREALERRQVVQRTQWDERQRSHAELSAQLSAERDNIEQEKARLERSRRTLQSERETLK
eukprot:g2599.t1